MFNFEFLVLLALCAAAVARNCKVDKFRFQEDFDMSRYPKKLYYQLYFNPSYTTVINEDGMTSNTPLGADAVSVRKTHRVVATGECKEFTLTTVNELGTSKLTTTLAGSTRSYLFHVAATDYQNYWMLYRCSELNEDGTCKKPSLLYSSVDSEVPRKEDKRLAKKLARKYCLDKTQFVNLRSRKGGCPFA